MTNITDIRTFYSDVSETTSKVLAEVSELDLVTELTGPDRGAAIMAIEHIVFVHAKGADGFLDKGKADAVWEAVLAGLGVDMGQSRGKTIN